MQGSVFTLWYCSITKESSAHAMLINKPLSIPPHPQLESFRRPAFTELLDELGEVAESLEPPSKPEATTG